MNSEVGSRLREAREQQVLAVEDVAARLKVPPRYITALESGDVGSLPEPAFVRGYVRSYARLLHLDEAALLALLSPVDVQAPRPQLGMAELGKRGAAPRPRASRSGRRSLRWLWALPVLAVAGAAGWWLLAPAAPERVAAPADEDAGVVLAVPLPGVTPAMLHWWFARGGRNAGRRRRGGDGRRAGAGRRWRSR